jgi:hypothetical protein
MSFEEEVAHGNLLFHIGYDGDFVKTCKRL